MRRKLFLYAVILLGAVFLMDTLWPDLWVPRAVRADEEAQVHYGRVVAMVHKEDHWDLTVMDERGFKVRLGCYRELAEPWKTMEAEIVYTSCLSVPEPARNPHCFNYRRYLRSQEEYLKGSIKNYRIVRPAAGVFGRYKAVLCELKYRFAATLPADSRALIIGMIFGDTGDMPEDLYDDFRRNGTAHILAVSGLHINLLYSLYERISGGKTSGWRLGVLVFLMVTYGTLSSWRPSVIRAELMIAMKTVARMKELRYDSLTAMSLAGIVLVIGNPYVIFAPGFQMSFLAITSINFIVKVIPKKVPDSLAQTLAVNATLMAYQAYVYNYISPLSWLINVPILYLAGVIIPMALGCFGGYAVFDVLGVGANLMPGGGASSVPGEFFAGGANDLLQIFYVPTLSMTKLLVKANQVLGLGGRLAVDVISPPQALVIFMVIALLFGTSEYAGILRMRGEKPRLKRLAVLILGVSLVASVICYEPLTHDQIVFVDVGQGACTHVRAGSRDVLIDGGGSATYNVGKRTLKPYLLKNGARDLDLALATHEDADHIKGLEDLLECFNVKDFRVGVTCGQRYRLTDYAEIRVLWPLTLEEGHEQENENSSCFMIIYRGIRVLVTGDLDTDGEKNMLSYYQSIGRLDDLRADVLNVGHHGSKTSTSEEFLEAVAPRMAVIQVGRNNYGHPTREVLDRLAAHGVQVFRNDRDGAVGLRIARDGLLGLAINERGLPCLGEYDIRAVHVMIRDGE